jgi:phosphohistidine phosphatase
MLLYLMQHAEAKKEEEDPSRPLSPKGLQDAKKMAAQISKLDIVTGGVLHSGKLRARQSAEAISSGLAPSAFKTLGETDGLSPLDDPGTWADRLKYMTEDLILVGHLPHLGRLAALLLCGDKEKEVISFRMGAVACLERNEKGNWSLRWMITPEILP